MAARLLAYSRLRIISLVFALLNLLCAQSPAAPVSAPHLTVDLIADSATVAAAQDFQAGLKFNLEKGWHIYWINPGDSGEPPKVQWKLPDGFQAGSIEWPAPVRLPISRLMDYGYEDQVLLMVPIRAPANLKPGGTVQLAATVKWIVCREVCIPGHGDVALPLPVSSDTPKPSADHDLFAKTKTSLPLPAPRTWKQSAVAQKDDLVLTIRTGKPVNSAIFFPLEADQIENAAPQQVHSTPTGVRIELKKSEQLLKPVPRLQGVAVLDGKPYEINASVVAHAPAK
ncbi:MAG TPA: protein-disulfide reductase DsbD domain-containing protein [Terriglobales bacterium]|jgi:DsbC/DsbD-like thiol-disulfide interchange protein|nr:protein-disulfide reductase DsbD domain-containing protein [Terriglobales bacterium]